MVDFEALGRSLIFAAVAGLQLVSSPPSRADDTSHEINQPIASSRIAGQFSPGTKVETPDGARGIETLMCGDRVWAPVLIEGQLWLEARTIVAVHARPVQELLVLGYRSEDGQRGTLELGAEQATPEVGAPLLLADGRRAWIEQVDRRTHETIVLGLEIEAAQGYFVGPTSGSEALLARSQPSRQ